MPPRVVPCPTCNRPVQWTDASSWRPFCSERCRLIDLGAWISEERGIPGDDVPNSDPPEPGPPRNH